MSIFDLFRGFFRVPGSQREPFFDGLTHEDDDDDEEEGGFNREYLGRFDDAFRFSFSLGPNGMRIEEPQTFGQIFRDMEEIFAGLGNFRHDMPSIEAPPQESRKEERSRDSLRDYMLKKPDDSTRDAPRDVEPPSPRGPNVPWRPFSRDIWSDGPRQRQGETKEDSDLDSQVSSEGLDQILSRAPPQPKTRSFFQSVTVTKVVKPDGTVEERRTVRDGQGNEETTVTRSGGPGSPEGRRDDPASPSAGAHGPFSELHDETTMFSKFFGRFRS